LGLPLSPSLSLSIRVSLSRNEFIDHTPIFRPQPRLQSKMASHSLRSPISFRGTSHPISTAQPWQSSVPVEMRARQNRTLNRSRSCSIESANPLVWRRLGTQTVRSCGPHSLGDVGPSTLTVSFMALIFLRERRLTRPALDSVRKSMRSPTISRLPIPSTFTRTISTTKSSGRF